MTTIVSSFVPPRRVSFDQFLPEPVLIKNSGREASSQYSLDLYLKNLLAHDTVTRCGSSRVVGRSKLKVCDNAYRCVNCSVNRLAERKAVLGNSLRAADDVAMLTFTQAHTSGAIAPEWDALEATLLRFTSSGGFDGFKKRRGISGHSVTVEHTFSDRGWHPHVHIILTFHESVPAEAVVRLRDDFVKRWVEAAAHTGSVASPVHQAVRMIPLSERYKIAHYVTKQTLLKENGEGGSLTPGGLLALAYEGDEDALVEFLAYAEAAKGRALIRGYGGAKSTSDEGSSV